MTEQHATDRDEAAYSAKKPPAAELLRHAAKESGRGAFELAREYIRLQFGKGKLTLPEYVQYGVYKLGAEAQESQDRFITNNLHWPITHQCCDMTWQATTEDKWLCSDILSRSSIAVPQSLAVIDVSERSYPGTRKINNANDLRDFATKQSNLPFFGKENRGICSFGAFLVEEASPDQIHLTGEGWMSYDDCISNFIGDSPYLLQNVVTNHSFFDAYTNHLATVRVCVLVDKDEVKVPFCVLKLASGENLVDSFWRPGNIACNIDPKSGRVLTIKTKNPLGTKDHDTHPDTGKNLLGEHIPMWGELLTLVNNCSPIFQPVRYQSMDIAITEDGPVLIEINTGGGFDLPQLASGEGFLTDEVEQFFKSSGFTKL